MKVKNKLNRSEFIDLMKKNTIQDMIQFRNILKYSQKSRHIYQARLY